MFNYQNKTTLITGASTGIGKCFAEELAKRGSHLILTARSVDKLEALAAEIRKTSGVKVSVIPADLSTPGGPKSVFDQVQAAGLSVDLLINNAGFGAVGFFDEGKYQNFLNMIQVNVSALTALTHLFLPGMKKKAYKMGQVLEPVPFSPRFHSGVINVASTASFQPLPKLALYAATKAFVLSLTEALWAENKKHGIKFFCLCPGNTESEFHDRAGVIPRYRFLRAPTLDLVRFGLDKFERTHQITAVHGLLNNILAQGSRFFPRKWVVSITSLLYR